MAKIKVNYQNLRTMAGKIENYCTQQDAAMRGADQAVKGMLTSGWTGPDAMAFGGQWEGVDEAGATAGKFKQSLENYADALNACASVYQKAQEDVYNRSCLLRIF